MFLRNDGNCQFKILIDICGVDYPQRNPRFEVVYNLLSLTQNQRIRIKLLVDEDVSVPTATGVYSSAGWFEREAWDLYGIIFSNHDDLRRILTDYGFEGHPLRKDFPLTGHVEVRYDESQKRVVYDPVKLTQDYRTFDFLSPWEGMKVDLPGDEKASEKALHTEDQYQIDKTETFAADDDQEKDGAKQEADSRFHEMSGIEWAAWPLGTSQNHSRVSQCFFVP